MAVTVIESIVKVKNASDDLRHEHGNGKWPMSSRCWHYIESSITFNKGDGFPFVQLLKVSKTLALNSSTACSLVTIGKDLPNQELLCLIKMVSVKMRQQNEIQRWQFAYLLSRICQSFRVQAWSKMDFLMHVNKCRIRKKSKASPADEQCCISNIEY